MALSLLKGEKLTAFKREVPLWEKMVLPGSAGFGWTLFAWCVMPVSVPALAIGLFAKALVGGKDILSSR